MPMPIKNLSTDQIDAIDLCCNATKRIVGVTGEAGTGKSVTLGEATEQLLGRGYNVVAGAPTGRAAARLKELTGIHAKTIHRLLGWGMPDPNDPEDEGMPVRNKANPIPADFLFIDEASMMSEELYRALIDAMQSGACIRFFGDANQLPPVNSISPFLKLLRQWPSEILTHNYRSDSGIIQAAHQILRGIVPSPNDQFSLLHVGNNLALTTLDAFLDEDFATANCQIIIPTKIGKYGTVSINKYVQQKLNPSHRKLELSYVLEDGEHQHTLLRPGDKIIWTKNDYKLNLFNGQLGYVVDFDEYTGDVTLNIDGRDKLIPPHLESYDKSGKKLFPYDPRKYIDLAYAITTHKSQGSEFAKVVLLLNRTAALVRSNFYTGVTRAREHVTVIAGTGGLSCAMRTTNGLDDRKR